MKARLRRFELVALVFKLLDLRQNFPGLRRFLFEIDSEFLRLEKDVRLAAQFGNEKPAVIADPGRVNVFISPGIFFHRINVDAALVGKGRAAGKGLV